MPMLKGKSRKTISTNIKEFPGGKTFKATKAKFGKAKADKQAVAAALSTARRSRGKTAAKKKAAKKSARAR